MVVVSEEILILCKTYPSPSGKYAETTCVAGMTKTGRLVRLFPVPFRLISENKKFNKWQWITAKVEKARKDHRPESFSIKVDTIALGSKVPTAREWAERKALLSLLECYTDFNQISVSHDSGNISLALLKPAAILGLDITPVQATEWTDEELAKLVQEQRQLGMFEDSDRPALKTLRKLPYDFHYRYRCDTPLGPRSFRHKLVDWEIGALFWRCHDNYHDEWEKHFRSKIENEIPSRDVHFLMGNMHRFQGNWLIISLIYPPIPSQLALI